MNTLIYPSGPHELPKGLTRLPANYHLKATLAILGILLFFTLYAAMVASLSYLLYWAITYDMVHVNKLTILGKLAAIAGSLMLLLFTLKFILKLKNHKAENRIKLDKKEYQTLWNFVLQICKDTGAPKPKAIYVDPDVNAYVNYSNVWLSLFLPVRKELTIGLGLVSCLNLSEFKAVISHEFGHFAQRSMTIGSYIISANTIIHDMIFSRDKWDELLDDWRGSDLRLSAAAWVITPVIWLIRQMLNLFYQFLNIMYSMLSREMEFNADKVAIKTSGSEAIISALWKLDPGAAHWEQTLNHAYLATQKGQFVKNLYHHNQLAIERSKTKLQAAEAALPMDDRGGKRFFSGSEHSKVNMYASHPPNDKRMDNAKVPFVDCAIDERSPWLLFDQKEQLQERVSAMIYEKYFNKKPSEYVNEAAFEAFMAEEAKGNTLLEEYLNTFQNRFLQIPEMEKLEEMAASYQPQKTDFTQLKEQLVALMKPVQELEALMETAGQIAQGTTKLKSFDFENKTFKKKNIQEGYAAVSSKREQLFNEGFVDWDAAFCKLHLALAKQLNRANELKSLYKQHLRIVDLFKNIVSVKNGIYEKLAELQSRNDVIDDDIRRFSDRIFHSMMDLNKVIKALEDLDFVPMPNIQSIEELQKAVIDGGAFRKEIGNIFENGGFDRILTQLNQAVNHCQRIDQKSIGVILSLHHSLQEEAEQKSLITTT